MWNTATGRTISRRSTNWTFGTGGRRKVASLKKAVSEMAVASDARRLALITAPEDKVLSFEGNSEVENLGRRLRHADYLGRRTVAREGASPYGRLNSLVWSKDGRTLAFVIAFDGYPSEVIIARWDGNDPTIFKLDRPTGVSLHASVDSPLSMRWRGDTSDLCFLGDEKGRVRIYCAADVPREGSAVPVPDTRGCRRRLLRASTPRETTRLPSWVTQGICPTSF